MIELTKKQKKILDFINNYADSNGIYPTIDEIRKKFRLKAISTIHQHLSSLKEKGYIQKDTNSPRSIRINNVSLIKIPIVGEIAAGEPIEAIESYGDYISLPKNGQKWQGNYYALRVTGNSMIEDGIFDGDIVVIKKQSVAENGQTVVAIIDDGQATLKRIYREKNKFRLQPANQELLPLYRSEVEIRGVVIQIIRNISNKDKGIKKESRQKFRTLDLFAGIGGIRMGFENIGFRTVFSNDFEPQCKSTYDLNFNNAKLIVEDIKKIDIDNLPMFDFLLAGFPCQAFSIAGYRQGFNDEKGRGNLFFDIARIIEERKPLGFMLENVKNLKSHDGGKTYKIIEKTLEDLGYNIKSRVLNSMEYGNIPQNRERIYIVGFKDKNHYNNFSFPDPVKLTVSVSDLLEKRVPEKYYYNGKPLFSKLKNQVKETGKVYQWRRHYVRENKKGVCPTLTANMGMGGHNVPIIKDKNGIRKLTPYECARIQGFPKEYKLPEIADSALYKQFGNSVTVTVIEAIAKKIRETLSI